MRAPSLAAVALFAALASFGDAGAEQLYIIDKLVLNVYSEPNQQGERVTQLETGDAVESLERDGNFVHVRLADGREGWLGANYLASEPPARVRLKELENTPAGDAQAAIAQVEKKMSEEVSRLQKQNAALKAEMETLKKAPPAAAAPAVKIQAPPTATRSAEPITTVVQTTAGAPWWGLFVAALVAAMLGFGSGYARLASRIRKKYGSLRIY